MAYKRADAISALRSVHQTPIGSGRLLLIDRNNRLGLAAPATPTSAAPAAPKPAAPSATAGPGGAPARPRGAAARHCAPQGGEPAAGGGRAGQVLAVYYLPPGMGAQQLVDILRPAGGVDEAYVEPGFVDDRGKVKMVRARPAKLIAYRWQTPRCGADAPCAGVAAALVGATCRTAARRPACLPARV